MRDWILKVHIYATLICASYLIIFGITSLHMNHRAAFPQPAADKVFWERPLEIENIEDNKILAAAIRDSLGLFGWPIGWEMRREDNGNLRFGLARPAKKYTIHVLLDERRVKVEEERKGFWAALYSLHALMRVPGSPFMSLWGVYTELCTWTVLFAAASGIYLWTARRNERRIGWMLLGGASGISLFLMLYVWLWE